MEITSQEEFEKLVESSQLEPVWLFKYSPICPTSFQAEYELKKFQEKHPASKIGNLNVVAARALSREIAEQIDVKHESPQGVLFYKKEVVWHGSHYDVNVAKLENALKSL